MKITIEIEAKEIAELLRLLKSKARQEETEEIIKLLCQQLQTVHAFYDKA